MVCEAPGVLLTVTATALDMGEALLPAPPAYCAVYE